MRLQLNTFSDVWCQYLLTRLSHSGSLPQYWTFRTPKLLQLLFRSYCYCNGTMPPRNSCISRAPITSTCLSTELRKRFHIMRCSKRTRCEGAKAVTMSASCFCLGKDYTNPQGTFAILR